MNQSENSNTSNVQYEISDPAAMSIIPLVSVSMITYNHGPYLAEAIEGVVAQKTDFPIELIIGEDCSTDNTREIALDYQRRYPYLIRVIYSDRNVGAGANFTRVLAACRGEFVAFCEGDDYWTDPKKLQKQVDFMENHNEYFICGHLALTVDESGVPAKDQICTGESCPEDFTVMNALTGTPLHPNTWLFRRFDVTSHPFYQIFLELPAGDDPFMLMLLQRGPGHCIKEYCSAYRIHSGGIWSPLPPYAKSFKMLQFRIIAPLLASVPIIYRIKMWVRCSQDCLKITKLVSRDAISQKTLRPFQHFYELLRGQRILGVGQLAGFLSLGLLLTPIWINYVLYQRIKERVLHKTGSGATN